jgi:hypothetical protein
MLWEKLTVASMECSFFQIPKGFKISKEYDGLENPPGAGEVDSGH